MDGHVVDIKMDLLDSSCPFVTVKQETGKTAFIGHSFWCGVCLSSSYAGKVTKSGHSSKKLEEACPPLLESHGLDHPFLSSIWIMRFVQLYLILCREI